MLYQDNMPNPILRARMELQLLQDFFNAMVPLIRPILVSLD